VINRRDNPLKCLTPLNMLLSFFYIFEYLYSDHEVVLPLDGRHMTFLILFYLPFTILLVVKRKSTPGVMF